MCSETKKKCNFFRKLDTHASNSIIKTLLSPQKSQQHPTSSHRWSWHWRCWVSRQQHTRWVGWFFSRDLAHPLMRSMQIDFSQQHPNMHRHTTSPGHHGSQGGHRSSGYKAFGPMVVWRSSSKLFISPKHGNIIPRPNQRKSTCIQNTPCKNRGFHPGYNCLLLFFLRNHISHARMEG